MKNLKVDKNKPNGIVVSNGDVIVGKTKLQDQTVVLASITTGSESSAANSEETEVLKHRRWLAGSGTFY